MEASPPHAGLSAGDVLSVWERASSTSLPARALAILEVAFPDSPVAGGRRFRIDITEAVLTYLNDAGDQLVVESWHPGVGTKRLERR